MASRSLASPDSDTNMTQPISQTIHPAAIRIMHWINAAATLVMILSGWQIYNAYPILPFAFPTWMTLGGWLGGALLWHFAAMWVLVANGIAYLAYGLVSGRFNRKFQPLSAKTLFDDFRAAVRGRLAHADLSKYNAVQKFSYVAVIGLLALVVLSGFAVWKPVQFGMLCEAFGGFQGSRIVHFGAMVGIVAFVLIHVGMSLLVPRSLLAMIRGR
jgi:thiosulfate reductase cytochrome b subunit